MEPTSQLFPRLVKNNLLLVHQCINIDERQTTCVDVYTDANQLFYIAVQTNSTELGLRLTRSGSLNTRSTVHQWIYEKCGFYAFVKN